MGATLHYRGFIRDAARTEELEDRVVDLALEVGGRPRVWRSWDEDRPERLVKGLFVDLAPGLETLCLLISPEGWVIGGVDIEDAEKGRVPDRPWVSCKTEYGSLDAHVMTAELLDGLRGCGLLALEIRDETGYLPDRDVTALVRRRVEAEHMVASIRMRSGRPVRPRRWTENTRSLTRRIQQTAQRVRKLARRPLEHPMAGVARARELRTEQQWDAFYRQRERFGERVRARIAEGEAAGLDIGQAIARALDAERALVGADTAELCADSETELRVGLAALALPDPRTPEDEKPQPLVRRAQQLAVEVGRRSRKDTSRDGLGDVLDRAVFELMGALAQALPLPDGAEVGWALVQLRRALRAAAFAQTGLIAAQGEGWLDAERASEHLEELSAIEGEAIEHLRACRATLAGG